MKPHIICHMSISLDGRIVASRWRPSDVQFAAEYERIHDEIGCDAWIVGRVTGQDFEKRESYPESRADPLPRTCWYARRDAEAFAVVIDADGKIAWGRSDIGGDPIVVVLTEKVTDAYLAALRVDGVSYIFAGRERLDFAAALEILNRDLGIKRVLLEGGGIVNGSFLHAGLIDEISLIVVPTIDGAAGTPSVFDTAAPSSGLPAPIAFMKLSHCEVVAGGNVWLRYKVNEVPSAT